MSCFVCGAGVDTASCPIQAGKHVCKHCDEAIESKRKRASEGLPPAAISTPMIVGAGVGMSTLMLVVLGVLLEQPILFAVAVADVLACGFVISRMLRRERVMQSLLRAVD